MLTRLSLARQKRLVRLGAVFVFVMVLLPNIAYVGHWSPPAETTHAHSGQTEQQTNDHAVHCHNGPSQCSGAQSTIGTWWIGDDPNPITANEPRRGVQVDDSAIATEPPSNRILRPPKFA
jgi:hypothetical protein